MKTTVSLKYFVTDCKYQLSFWTKYFGFLDQIGPTRLFMVITEKNEHHHWILFIRISLWNKIQLKLTIMIFWTKFFPKMVFLVVRVKIAIARVSMVLTYYIKFFRMGTDRHNGILMFLLLLVADTKIAALLCS